MGVLADKELRGVVPRLTDDLFDRVDEVLKKRGGNLGDVETPPPESETPLEDAPVRFMITVSFLEIYNEVIHDLLNPQSDKPLKVREHPDMGIYVENLCELSVKGPADIFRLIDQGNRVRRVASTAMNERSSRSHSVFTLKLQQKSTKTIEEGVERETALSSKINLVDLAGSERADKTGAEGSTLKEGAAINQSLMALGGVINALSENAPFIPYRNSKLTRLLQESLGGNAGTVMVANVSPADYNADETVGTLRYASRAKKIQNKVVRNEDVHERVIRELQEEIERLRSELANAGGTSTGGGDLTAEQQAALDAAREKEKELQDRLADMERAKDTEWQELARLTAALEEERKNNLNRAVSDVMSSVKQEKLALIHQIRELQDDRSTKAKTLANLKEVYKSQKKDLEFAMGNYEARQTAHDQLDKDDPTFDESADSLLHMLNDIEQRRNELIDVRSKVADAKNDVHKLEQDINAKRAELQAAASTIAENDRLRSAIQEEERLAFQSQRDAYLNEQLQAEKDKLEEQKKLLQDKERALMDPSNMNHTSAELAAVQRKADLLQQELDMYKSERDHLKEQIELLSSDLDHAHSDHQKVQEELQDTEARLHTAEFEVEAERERAEGMNEQLWEVQRTAEATTSELQNVLVAKERELAALGKVAIEHKENARRDALEGRMKSLKEEKIAAIAQAQGRSLDGLPDVAEAKIFGGDPESPVSTATGDGKAQAKLGAIVHEKDRRILDLERQVLALQNENDRLTRDAKEQEFKVFKNVMDVAKKDRNVLTEQNAELQRLLKQSVTDILFLQQQSDEYKRELDLRRGLDTD